jgi:hypothetical protein
MNVIHGVYNFNKNCNCWALLQYTQEVTADHFIVKGLGCYTKAIIILYDNARPHTANQNCDLLQHYGWEVIDHHVYRPISCPVNSIPLGPLQNICLASNWQQMLLWTKLSPSVSRHLTSSPSMLKYKPWCHCGTNA